ncbi:hypothetical protein DFH09DRAFT_1083693 [Mycena vulgaris]|nr:hypothetical protein DFH09DRAFT_1083693 [Mycena vulgaris]
MLFLVALPPSRWVILVLGYLFTLLSNFFAVVAGYLLGTTTTYEDLPKLLIFPPIHYNSVHTNTASHTASYAARFPAVDPPRFVYCDRRLRSYALSRYENAIRKLGIEKRACPPQISYWNVLIDHCIEEDEYNGEPWVGSLMNDLVFFLKPLVRDMLFGTALIIEYPVIFASQRGDRGWVLKKAEVKDTGIAVELKTTLVLDLHDMKADNIQHNPISPFWAFAAATDIQGNTLPGLAISERIALSLSSVDGSPSKSKSLATLILGMMMPPNIVPYHDARDPAIHGEQRDWDKLEPQLDQMLGGHGRGLGGGVGRRARDAAGEGQGRVKTYRPPSKIFNPPLPLVVIECEDIADRWGPPEADLRSPPSRSPSPAPSYSLPATPSESSQEGPSLTSSPSGENMKRHIQSGPSADVLHGTLHEPGVEHYSSVVLKAYDLLMEDAGTPLGSAIYAALFKIHEMGIQHGDVAPRNVVRRRNGGITFIDFGSATEHCCLGWDICSELTQSRQDLAY